MVVEMRPNAESQTPSGFRIRHFSDADGADDADNDIPLAFDQGADTQTTCRATYDLNLKNRSITAPTICEAGTDLRAGPQLEVSGTGAACYFVPANPWSFGA